MGLRYRFNLLLTLIMTFFIITLMFVMMTSSRNSILEGVESAHKVTMQLLDTVIVSSAQNPNWGSRNNSMAQFLVQLGYVRNNQSPCTYISGTYHLLRC